MLVIFASTPEQDMVLIVDEGYGELTGLQQVSDEQMAQVEGNRFSSAADGAGPITKSDIKQIFIRSKNIFIDFDVDKIEHIISTSYTENTNGSYTITLITIGITQKCIISEDDFLQIQIYAASHNLSIVQAIILFYQ